jgi:hypothetical protein
MRLTLEEREFRNERRAQFAAGGILAMAEYHALERRTRETAKRLRTERLVREAVSGAVESAQPAEPLRRRKAKKR